MTQALDNLLTLLELTPLQDGRYQGECEHLGLPQVYGGQVIGQALSAARYTVPDHRTVHSFHSYFLYPGNPDLPIIYDVENLRDGKSFSTRRVKAMQNGRPVFFLTASYHQCDATGFEHQNTMPDIPGPENYLSESALFEQYADHLPPIVQKLFDSERPIEIRPVHVVNLLKPAKTDPKQYLWIRSNGALPDNQLLHQYLLGYASDWEFITTAMMPHGVTLMTPDFQVATIDHSIWFHRPVKMDEWLLFAIESPNATNGRGLVRGEIYNQQGDLIASAMQEGVMRFSKKD
jgi:acyl-CoA thioesterase-2